MASDTSDMGLGRFIEGGLPVIPSGVRRTKVTEVFSSEIVNNRKTLTKHLHGAGLLKAVVYVSSPMEVLRLLDDLGVEQLELVMGHQRVHDFKSELTVHVVERLAALRAEGRLALYTSDRVHFHSKLYIAEFDSRVKLLNGSANLTKTGIGITGKQVNQIWVCDVNGDVETSEFYQQVISQYEQYKEKTEEFFGDFAEIFTQVPQEERVEIIEQWIKTGDIYGAPEDVQTRKVTRLILDEVMSDEVPATQHVVEVLPSAASTVVEKVHTQLQPIGVTIEQSGTMAIPTPRYHDHTFRTFPMLYVDEKARKVKIGWAGERLERTATEYDPHAINAALELFEDFVNSVDLAEPKFPKLAKMSVFEAVLYILCSPFHHLYMQRRREIYGLTEQRGPRILHLYGGTSNGKSQLLTYTTKLITGKEIITPQDGEKFSASTVRDLRTWQSVFPMMFDDLTNDRWSQHAEKVIKTYWDKRWRDDEYCPQIVLTSNRQCPRGPLLTRVKEIVLDSTYPRSDASRQRLASHFNRENPIFEYFSKAYLETEKTGVYSDDEAHIGRVAFKELYKRSGRIAPDWMAESLLQPLERNYDPGAVKVLKAILSGACTIGSKDDELVLTMDEQMAHWEVTPYFDAIPVDHAVIRRGNKFTVRRKDRFAPWLQNALQWVERKRLPRQIRRVLS